MNEYVNIDEKYVSVPLAFIEAVAHIGVDFGYGKYELDDKWLEFSRRIYENEKNTQTIKKP